MALADILQTRLGVYAAIAAAIVAISGAAAGAWNIADKLEIRPVLKSEMRMVQDAQQQTIKTLALFRFQYLKSRLEANGILSFDELQEYCSLAKELHFVQIRECGL